jgi:hypothetical protein
MSHIRSTFVHPAHQHYTDEAQKAETKASTCQEISWQKEILGSGAGKMPGNPFWKEIDRKYNELPG